MKQSGIVTDARRGAFKGFLAHARCRAFASCLALAYLALVGLASCGARLGVTRGPSVEYRSTDGGSLKVDYYSLSDGSLSFVKLTLPDGTDLTLPSNVSASGARYTDDREYVWWEKGETAFLEKRDESGEFRAVGEYSRTDGTR